MLAFRNRFWRNVLFFLIFVVNLPAYGFIPSLNAILKHGVFAGRKGGMALEVVLRHRIQSNAGVWALEEKIVGVGENLLVQWQTDGGVVVRAKYRKGTYQFSPQESFVSRLGVLIPYLFENNWENFKSVLLAQSWTTRDQWDEFLTGFDPSGDPKTWDLAKFYVKQPDISLQRAMDQVWIVVQNPEAEGRNSVAFDRGLNVIRGFSGVEGSPFRLVFEEPVKISLRATQSRGYYPKRWFVEKGGVRIIQSELVRLDTLSSKQHSEFMARFRQMRATRYEDSGLQEVLSTLLLYR